MRSFSRQFHVRAATLVLAIAAFAGTAALGAQVPTSLTFFGDSFLDTGNGDIISQQLLGRDLTPSPPYAPGRVTNGLNWADYLAAMFGRPGDAAPSFAPAPFTGRNFAVATATTGVTGAEGVHVGMLAQLALYPGAPVTDPTGLYVLGGGGNDVLATEALTPAQQLAALSTSVGNMSTIVQTLYAYGARSFLIPTLPDIGLAPVALGQASAPVLTAGAMTFNQLLTQQLSVLGGILPGAHIMTLNLNNLFTNIRIDAAQGGAQYGMTNTTVPCFLAPVPCSDAVFADALHPTTQVHALIANAAYARVVYGQDVAVVPEPATLWMMGSGLLLCGVLTRRRACVRRGQRRGALDAAA